MSFLDTLKTLAEDGVKDVEAIGAKVVSGIKTVGEEIEQDVQTAEQVLSDDEKWLVDNAPQIAAGVETFLVAVGAADAKVMAAAPSLITGLETLLARLADLIPAA